MKVLSKIPPAAFALLLLLALPLMAAELSPYVNTNWGASPQKVIFWEKGDVQPHKSETDLWHTDYLTYHRTVFNWPFELHYEFENGKLCSTNYFLESDTARNLTMADAKAMLAEIDAKLTPKMNNPHVSEVEKMQPTDGHPAVWRYAKLLSNERTSVLVFVLVDENNSISHFSVIFADAKSPAALALQSTFDNISDYAAHWPVPAQAN